MKKWLDLSMKSCGMVATVLLLASASCEHTTKTADDGKPDSTTGNLIINVAFYNVENLFDTMDDPKTMDEDFTPSGKLKWDSERYRTKLNHIAEVMDALPGELPAFIGMCEIENRAVLQDLVNMPVFGGRYAIIHKDSPDERGIDAAAIYDSTRIKLEFSNFTTINLPDEKDPFTRDLLYVKASANKEVLHLFVNHWPSRGGGQAESEKNRIAVANVLESLTGKIMDTDPRAKILIMGDFNDHPTDISISQTLKAGVNKDDQFYNYMYDEHAAGKGSYYYKGAWGALDQFIGSQELKNASRGWSADEDAAFIFFDDLVLFQDKEGVKRPNRTYVGEDYKGGYSDHLPVYISLTYR